MTEKSKNLFLALVVMLLWGTLFPFVKIGYQVFEIDTSNYYNILFFAGMRFTICGCIITICSLAAGKRLGGQKKKTLLMILLTGLFATILHYAFTYIGLSLIESSKTAIVKQIGSLVYICTSFLFIKEEQFSVRKLLGGVLGFAGIIVINLGNGKVNFSLGTIFILCASFCTVISNLFGKKALSDTPSSLVTGISQLFGGIVLLIVGFSNSSKYPVFTLKSTAVFSYICIASIVSYLLWYFILEKANLSNLFIIKFSEPLFALLFSYILLGESILSLQNAFSLILISMGIFIAHKSKKQSISSL